MVLPFFPFMDEFQDKKPAATKPDTSEPKAKEKPAEPAKDESQNEDEVK